MGLIFKKFQARRITNGGLLVELLYWWWLLDVQQVGDAIAGDRELEKWDWIRKNIAVMEKSCILFQR